MANTLNLVLTLSVRGTIIIIEQRSIKGGMRVANLIIRQAAKEKRVKHWEICERLGAWESAFSRSLRHELPAEEQCKILAVIDTIAKEREAANAE